jgi:hypothetical protein
MSKFGATHIKRQKPSDKKRELVVADPEQDEIYVLIEGIKGDARFNGKNIKTGQEIIAKARSTLSKGRNKARIQIGDTVLVQEGKDGFNSYILLKYTEDEINKLTKMKELISFKAKSDEASNILFDNQEENGEEEVKIDISAI